MVGFYTDFQFVVFNSYKMTSRYNISHHWLKTVWKKVKMTCYVIDLQYKCIFYVHILQFTLNICNTVSSVFSDGLKVLREAPLPSALDEGCAPKHGRDAESGAWERTVDFVMKLYVGITWRRLEKLRWCLPETCVHLGGTKPISVWIYHLGIFTVGQIGSR